MTDQAVEPTTAGPGPEFFTGRDRELRALHEDIERVGLHTLSGRPLPHSRVLLIAGAPGSGRTALAEEFVRRIADRYPSGVLRARLTDPGGVPVPAGRAARALLASLARSDGLPAAAATPPPGTDEAAVTEQFRTALARRGRTVLLLDDVAGSEQVLDLAPQSRDCLVVAVGSGPLTAVPDVRPCTLGGLDRAASVALLARHLAATPRITVDPRGTEVLAEQCGDLPAALMMVGGWLAARPKLAVLDATRALTDQPEPADAPAPAPLVRAFRLVHGSLANSSARLLRLLTLASAGLVDPQTASALAGCSVTAAHAALDDFVRLGLLRALGGDRYELPGCLDPLLRAERAVRERPGETMLARARMLERLVRRLQACRAVCEPAGSAARKRLGAMPYGLRFAGRAQARAWLEERRPALLAAVRMAVAEGGGELDKLALRLVSALGRAFDAHREPEEAAPDLYGLHELVLRVAERGRMPRERAAALLNLADMGRADGPLRGRHAHH
ncbi:AAA family ATPase, partial [Streptomyces albus subsp. chlorinus]|uniref:AAA family ATPase n=1 Tax=Streptomyces albus TaxID=1888 RepID=UPI00156EB166|nr:AAA family ATPase [Streptomyces albus subsp. chlorinus]